MSTKVSRRSFIKKMLQIGVITICAGSGVHFYAKNIETKLLQITEHTIHHPLIPSGFEGLKILQFSDTHLGFHYTMNQFKKLITTINELVPDLIFFTGDLMDEPNKYPNIEKIIPLLRELKAPFGKYCVYGNHDHGGYGSDIYQSVMNQSNFVLLQNTAKSIKLIDGSTIYIVGIDDAMLGKPNFEAALADVPEHSFKILLSHAPELADQAFLHKIELQLSGHSHGGQIKIPFFGAIITPPFAQKYKEGFYKISTSSHSLTLYVNRGIGTTRLPFRFLSQPELTLISLSTND